MKLSIVFASCGLTIGCVGVASKSADPPFSPAFYPSPTVIFHPTTPPAPVDAGVSEKVQSDWLPEAGTTESGNNVSDAGADSSHIYPVPACDGGESPNIVGHCLTDMATLCQEYNYDSSYACLNSGTLVSGWWAGPCESGARSSGGCLNPCQGTTTWYYPLGGGNATAGTEQGIQDACLQAGLIYVSPS